MKKTLAFNAAVIAIAIFSASASADTRLHPSPQQAYVLVDSGPKGTEGNLLDNLHEIEHVSNFEPYVQTDSDRDDRDDLASNI